MTHAFHQTKFRWTENLTSRFIQLRKENGNLFTGRKYSAQAGWEHILQQMRQEFPTIMADVHYRVLKKKWSNLLQQYKELKNPVHGDKNKSDDVSWPFYGAIDEVLGYGQRNDDNDLNPHEFLCLSVTPEEPASPEEEQRLGLDSDLDHDTPSITAIKQIRNFNDDFSIEIERLPGVPIRRPRPSSRPSRISQELRRRDASEVLVSRLPPATELSIKTIRSSPCSSSVIPAGLRVRKFTNNKDGDDSPRQFLRDALVVTSNKRNGNHNMRNYNEEDEEDDDEVEVEVGEGEEEDEEVDEEELEEEDDDDDDEKQRPRKLIRRYETTPAVNINNDHQSNLEKRLTEFFEYTKKRDEENRIMMTRILNAVEKIAEK